MGNSQVRSSIELVPEGCLPAALPGHDRGAGPASRGKRELIVATSRVRRPHAAVARAG